MQTQTKTKPPSPPPPKLPSTMLESMPPEPPFYRTGDGILLIIVSLLLFALGFYLTFPMADMLPAGFILFLVALIVAKVSLLLFAPRSFNTPSVKRLLMALIALNLGMLVPWIGSLIF